MDIVAFLSVLALIVAVIALVAGRRRGGGSGTGGRPRGDGPTDHA